MRKLLMGCSAALAIVVFAGLVSTGEAAATEPGPIACDATALAHAFEVGGTYVYGANCELMLGTELTLHTATNLTLESGDHHVAFIGTDVGSPFRAGDGNRFATVDGHLTLEGIDVKEFEVGATTLDGTPGTPGTGGDSNTCPVCTTAGDGAERGSNGTDGGRGGDGRDAHGGALLIDGTGVVTLEVSEFSQDYATGGRGGAGGNGGDGGLTVDVNFANEGDTVPGGDAGNGGEGGSGGDGYGGAIENNGTLVVNLSRFTEDIAMGGTSVGGSGGEGGPVDGVGLGGDGGNGAAAGRTGSAFGGAIYNTGNLTLTNTEFISDYAGYTTVSFSGSGGRGGSSHERGGPGGDGAAPGPLGLVSGGDVYSLAAFTVTGGFANGVTNAELSEGGAGGRGGGGCSEADGSPRPSCIGVAGSPDPAGAPPLVRGQTAGETFVPTPNSGSGGGESPGAGGGEAPGGGSGGGAGGGSGTGGSGSTGNGSGSTGGPSGDGSGTGGGSNTGGSGSGSGAGGSGSGGGSGTGGHAVLGKVTDSGTTTTVPVQCPAAGSSCAITAELTALGGSGGADARRLLKALVLGRATATVRPGHSGILKLKLGADGRRLLSARHHLKAGLIVLQRLDGKETVLRSGPIEFRVRG